MRRGIEKDDKERKMISIQATDHSKPRKIVKQMHLDSPRASHEENTERKRTTQRITKKKVRPTKKKKKKRLDGGRDLINEVEVDSRVLDETAIDTPSNIRGGAQRVCWDLSLRVRLG